VCGDKVVGDGGILHGSLQSSLASFMPELS
jgi:hypothetical protein